MAPKSADPQEMQEIHRLALDSTRVQTTSTVKWDLTAQNLTKEDICDEIVRWIDAGERVKKTSLHSLPGLVGHPAFEMKPRVDSTVFYIKVAIIELGQPCEYLLLISAHPDH